MGQLTLPKSGTVYLDTSPVIYSVEKIAPYAALMAPVWQSAKSGAIHLQSSQLLLLEVLVKPVRDSDSELESIYRQLLTRWFEDPRCHSCCHRDSVPMRFVCNE